jgi:hypothetical protein
MDEPIFEQRVEEANKTKGWDFLVGVRDNVGLNDSLNMITGNDGNAILEIDDEKKLKALEEILIEHAHLRLLIGTHPFTGTFHETSQKKKKTQDLEKTLRMNELKVQFLKLLKSN